MVEVVEAKQKWDSTTSSEWIKHITPNTLWPLVDVVGCTVFHNLITMVTAFGEKKKSQVHKREQVLWPATQECTFSGFQCILWQQLHTEYFVDFNAFCYNSNILNPLWISAAHSTLSEISHKAGGFLLFSVSLQSWHNEYLVDSSGLFQCKSSSVIQLIPQWGFQISFPMRMDTTYLTLCGFQ